MLIMRSEMQGEKTASALSARQLVLLYHNCLLAESIRF